MRGDKDSLGGSWKFNSGKTEHMLFISWLAWLTTSWQSEEATKTTALNFDDQGSKNKNPRRKWLSSWCESVKRETWWSAPPIPSVLRPPRARGSQRAAGSGQAGFRFNRSTTGHSHAAFNQWRDHFTHWDWDFVLHYWLTIGQSLFQPDKPSLSQAVVT